MAVPQFGTRPAHGDCPDRPAAFAVLERAGRIALVEVPWAGKGLRLHLPGGGLDPGEEARAAATRECAEETGLRVSLTAEPFARADHYFLHHDGIIRNTRGAFFTGEIVGDDPAAHIEQDHRLVWRRPLEAIATLDRAAHAWAVAAWLRLRAGTVEASERP